MTRVRTYAGCHRQQLGEFAYRPPRIWVTEDDGEMRGAGPRTFTSEFKGDRVSRTLYVHAARRGRGPKPRLAAV